MRDTLRPGLTHELRYLVPEDRTVPHLLPESAEFAAMPAVLATGYMVGLVEWTCIQAVNPHLDWPAEQTVGTAVALSHTAATPPGMEVAIRVRLAAVEGRKLVFDVEARDEKDVISTGRHERFVIDAARFKKKVAEKAGEGRDSTWRDES
jgi:fluoroacetyl-CoA thioesterase